MRFEITPYDDHGTATEPDLVDLPTLRDLLADAATTGRRLHIRPQPRTAAPVLPVEENQP